MCQPVLYQFTGFTGTKVHNTDAAAAASLSQSLMCRQVLSIYWVYWYKSANTDAAVAAAESSEESAKKGLGFRLIRFRV